MNTPSRSIQCSAKKKKGDKRCKQFICHHSLKYCYVHHKLKKDKTFFMKNIFNVFIIILNFFILFYFLLIFDDISESFRSL